VTDESAKHEAPTPAGRGGLRTIRYKDPYVACGRTVAYLMRFGVFARLPFGHLARLIVGQINRRSYVFVIDDQGAVVGYCGWAQTSREQAQDWLERNVDIDDASGGPVCIVNIWQASSGAANAAIVGALRERVSPETERIVAKRFYPDGSIRRVSLPIAKSQLRPKDPRGAHD
jgi:hemolysin-activating ACP:hemolysin acyltransferase